MPKYPSTLLVSLADKLEKLADKTGRQDIETEVRKADLDLLSKANELSDRIDAIVSAVQTFTIAGVTYTFGKWYAYTPTFTGFGTVTGTTGTQWNREGGNLYFIIKGTTGTCTGVTAQITLPLSLVASAGLPSLNNIIGLGGTSAAGGAIWTVLVQPSQGYLTLSYNAAAANGPLASQLGNAFPSSTTFSISGFVPIEGWN